MFGDLPSTTFPLHLGTKEFTDENGEIKSDASVIGRGIDDLSLVDPQGRIRKDGEQYVVAFGRHRGKEISQIINEDCNYK